MAAGDPVSCAANEYERPNRWPPADDVGSYAEVRYWVHEVAGEAAWRVGVAHQGHRRCRGGCPHWTRRGSTDDARRTGWQNSHNKGGTQPWSGQPKRYGDAVRWACNDDGLAAFGVYDSLGASHNTRGCTGIVGLSHNSAESVAD